MGIVETKIRDGKSRYRRELYGRTGRITPSPIPWFLMERRDGRAVVQTMQTNQHKTMNTRICAALVLVLFSGATANAAGDRYPSGPSQGTEDEQAACAPDAARYCKDAIPDTFRVLECLQEHRRKLKRACRNVLKSHGVLAPPNR
ncbi:MAG TPA: cysteine rich repeat-containing protein [Bradyrhizobium sp.]